MNKIGFLPLKSTSPVFQIGKILRLTLIISWRYLLLSTVLIMLTSYTLRPKLMIKLSFLPLRSTSPLSRICKILRLTPMIRRRLLLLSTMLIMLTSYILRPELMIKLSFPPLTSTSPVFQIGKILRLKLMNSKRFLLLRASPVRPICNPLTWRKWTMARMRYHLRRIPSRESAQLPGLLLTVLKLIMIQALDRISKPTLTVKYRLNLTAIIVLWMIRPYSMKSPKSPR